MSERFEYEVDRVSDPLDPKLLEGRGWNRWHLVTVTIDFSRAPNVYTLFWKRTIIEGQ